MIISLFGASGRTGLQILKVANQYYPNYKFKVFVRSQSKFEELAKINNLNISNIEIVIGDARNLDDVKKVIRNSDVVINVLAPKLGDKKNYDVSLVAIQNIIVAMNELSVKRLIVQSGAWGTENEDDNNIFGRIAFKLMLSEVYKYKKLEDIEIRNSDLDWTIVRCALLRNNDKVGEIEVSERKKLGIFQIPFTSRSNVAKFMLDNVGSEKYMKKAVVVIDR